MAHVANPSSRSRRALLDWAVSLQHKARESVYHYRFARARAQAGRAIAVLDQIDDDPEATEVRVRLEMTLAYVDIEAVSLDEGLNRFAMAAELVARLKDPARQTSLAGLLSQQKALLLHRGGRFVEALDVFAEAITTLERAFTHDRSVVNELAGAYLNRGTSYIGLGKPRAAAQDLRRCIEVCRKHGEDLVAAKAEHNLGYVDYMFGDMVAALGHYATANRVYTDLAPSAIPVLLMDRARALLAAGLAEDSAAVLDEALPLLRKQKVGQDVGETEVVRAAAALLAGEVALARRLARAAKRRFERRGNTRWSAIAELAALRADTAAALVSGKVTAALPVRAVKLAETLRGLMLTDEMALALMLAARMQLRRGQSAVAANLLDQVRSPRATAPVDHRMLLRLCRAELAVAEGNRRRALAEARAGLTELGKARDRMGGLEMVCGTAIHGLQLGELAIRLVLTGRADARRLFGWLERTRAQVYRYEPVPQTVDDRTAEQVAEIRQLRRAVQLERLAGRPARKQSAQVAALERDVIRGGGYGSRLGMARPVAGLAEVADALGERALISFAVSGDDLVAVVVVARRTRLVRLGSAAAAIEAARRLHADLDALAPDELPAPIVEVVAGSAARGAAAVDRQLAPLWTIVGDRELVVVPTGALYAVPWGVLESLRGTPVMVAPSATAWLTAEQTPAPDGPPLLATGPALSPLIAEADRLRAAYPDAVYLAGKHATSAAVLDALDGARIAHVAAHGAHEPANALFSRLELADGPMFAHELSRLRRPPGQVVLAACELALNHVRPGDEALGYAGALLAGGVRTVVAAVSRVGDGAAAAAMVRHHDLVAAGTSPAAALAEVIAADPLRRPFLCMGAA